MSIGDSNEEALRESLLNIQRLREKEQTALKQSETLIKGLRILNESSSVSDIYSKILGTLQKVIPFECAAILIETSKGNLSTVVCTDNRLKFSRVPIVGIFQRCLDGCSTVLTDLSRVMEWPVSETSKGNSLSSAILVSLPGLGQQTLIICAGTDTEKLRKKDLSLLTTFTPLATQAVVRAGEIEQLNMLVSKLDYYAYYDMLTGLPNRTLFDIRLDQELQKKDNKFSVLFLDLDNFKHINDTYGHDVGDVLLSEISFRMTGVLGDNDTIARMGGDEFAVILRGEKDAGALSAQCDKIKSRLLQPLFLCRNRIEPTVSIGVAAEAQDVGSAQAIMQNADIALYDAKNEGRNCFSVFSPNMKNALNRVTEIEKRLKIALNNQEFRLAYQPIVCSQSLSCCKVEVLVRWEVDGVSLYSPDEFIPISEDTGCIRELGLWVFMKALSDLHGWISADSGRIVAINISDVQLLDPKLPEQLSSIVAETGIDPNQIELELSERIVASEIDETVSGNILKLQSKGFGFSFDDFGTGQSSFLNLQKFPGTTLKIDKTFIDELGGAEKQIKLIKGIVNFAHSLDLQVVAEGVETEFQFTALQNISCDYIQGYLFSRPLRLTEFLDWCEEVIYSQTRTDSRRKAG